MVGNNLGFKTGEAAKHAFTSHQTKYLRRKKTLKNLKRSGTAAEEVMKAEKDMQECLFLGWTILCMKEKNNLQNNEEDMKASETIEQYISEIDPDIFNDVDVQKRSSFIERSSSSLVSLQPEQPLGSENG